MATSDPGGRGQGKQPYPVGRSLRRKARTTAHAHPTHFVGGIATPLSTSRQVRLPGWAHLRGMVFLFTLEITKGS